VQTFLPYPSFTESAACLDDKRLGKQRVECLQIHNVLYGQQSKWKNHPAVKMWVGYELAFCMYMRAVIEEWERRGFKNTIRIPLFTTAPVPMPHWLGTPSFHASHRSNLLRKKPEHYGKFGWTEPNNLPYEWPVGKN